MSSALIQGGVGHDAVEILMQDHMFHSQHGAPESVISSPALCA